MTREGQRGFAWRKYSSAVAISVAGLSFACFAQGAQAVTSTPSCAWQYSSLLTNTLWPDSNAQYWVTPFTAQSDLKITVHGSYPSARYFSLTAYNAVGTGSAANEIHDTQITPGADGTFTVTVSHTSGPNTILLANAMNGVSGYLAFRVYLPTGNVILPSVTLTTNAGSVNLQPCTSYAPPPYIPGPFNNPDNVYVSMYPPTPSGSTVAVITGKAPTQVRYWSFCSYLWNSAVADCRYDGNTALTDGYYHLVLGQAAQKTAITSAGYTYLQYAGTVMLRNLLGDQTTGDFAPVVKTCALTDRTCIGG
jgi:hypothetical protein